MNDKRDAAKNTLEFQRGLRLALEDGANPPRLKSQWEGRFVKLRNDMESNGLILPAGTVMR